jgi:hypothetical protein
VSGSVVKEEWILKSNPLGIYVVGERVDERGTSKMAFFCDRTTHKLASMMFLPEPSNSSGDLTSAQLVARQTVDAGYFVDDEIHRLMSAGRKVTVIPVGKKASDPSEVQVIWAVSKADIVSITSAMNSTGFALLPMTPGIFYGVHLSLNARDRDMIRNYATDCWR